VKTMGDGDERFICKIKTIYIGHHWRYRKHKDPNSLSTVMHNF